ncbi:MAG: autotransporter outer membrane beta-barrel domain-containing protein [Verrucomicrobiota bacterium]
MKLLKTSFLLAAAATATQLDATDFNLTYTGSGSAGGTATGIIGINTSIIPSNYSGSTPAWITSFSLTVSGTTGGMGSINRTYNLSDIGYVQWGTAGSIDWTTNLIGQPNFQFLGLNMSYLHSHGSTLYDMMHMVQLDLTSFAPSFSGVTDVATWMSSINNQNRIYQTGVTLAELPLEGAHHRPMLSFDRMGKESQAWATGDFGSSSRTRDVHVTTGEAGVNWNVGKTGLIGFAAGHGEQNADLAYNGSSTTKGDYALVEYDYRPEGTQWIVSLLGMVGSWESKTNRGYTSGASTDSSFGVADIISRSARLRVDAPTLLTYGGFGFAPYASYSVTQTIVGAYTETGGAFPASFGEQSHNATEGRIGVTATKDVSAATKLLLTVEAIHRFDGVGPSLTGQDVTGGVSFSLPGVAPRADCVRFGFDVDHKLNENTLLNVSAHVATVGEAHDVSAAISIRRAF